MPDAPLGHQIGDDALREVAHVLGQVFRESDIIARMGGDEFVVLALEASQEHAENIALRVESVLDARNGLSGRKYSLSFSYGMAFTDGDCPGSVDDLILRADHLMYTQKREKYQAGRGL